MDASKKVAIARWDGAFESLQDVVAVEEPLEIRLGYLSTRGPKQQSVSITMRTPGDDFSLAAGFLFSEGILRRPEDIKEIVWCGDGANQNVVRVELADHVKPDLKRLQRHVYTTSSCGVCGKTSLEALELQGWAAVTSEATVSAAVLVGLPEVLRASQAVFEQTGGLHAVGEFSAAGELLNHREDVGRHNALDKLLGHHVQNGRASFQGDVLILSGRASFELVQKAIAARCPIVAAVGAPSSLAIELAEEYGITLAGFVRGGRMNVYSHPHRITSGPLGT